MERMKTKYIFTIIIIKQTDKQITTNPSPTKMHQKKPTLKQILHSWTGEQILLQVQGTKLVVYTPHKPIPIAKPKSNINIKIKKSEPGIGLFSRLAVGNCRLKENRGNGSMKVIRGSQDEFVIRANRGSQRYRVSLADLGEAYNTSRVNVVKERRISENYPPQYEPKQYPINPKLYPIQPNPKKIPTQYLTQPNPQPYQPHPSPLYNPHPPIRQPHPNHPTQAIETMEQIKESINGIKLPVNTGMCPDYASANDRFENMKREILEKIVESGEIGEVTDIIREIRQAADQIIARHYPVAPSLKKPNHGMFSFKDLQPQPHPQPNHPQPCPQNLQKIPEQPQPNLPQFKDDAGSISSILSMNGGQLKKDDSSSNNEDFCKIENVFIRDNQDGAVGESRNSIQPIRLGEEREKEGNDFQEIFKQVKEERRMEDTLRMGSLCQIENTVIQSQANNLATLKKAEQKPTVRQSQAQPQPQSQYFSQPQPQPQLQPQPLLKQAQNIPKKKQQVAQPPLHYQTYDLQKLTSNPVKIIQNLQQAKKFDPEVVKYTQLKVQFLQTRTRTPEIITIPSPLRFRRKEEVVKHLVATHIVDKESKSIQY